MSRRLDNATSCVLFALNKRTFNLISEGVESACLSGRIASPPPETAGETWRGRRGYAWGYLWGGGG